jgi:ubiquinone/menaquinone biosynthesis C-methylase UbiE
MENLTARIEEYWTRRAGDFAQVRRAELSDNISDTWMTEMENFLPENKKLKILDVGTGAGYFAIMFAEKGHKVEGIDLTEAMLKEAQQLAAHMGTEVKFRQMDAQNLKYEDEKFDVVVTRNLTWTLPNLEMAYQEWFRVLKPGGVLLNFDAAYGQEIVQKGEAVVPKTAYDHLGMTEALIKENSSISAAIMTSYEKRPEWDLSLLKKAGFTKYYCDTEAGNRILQHKNGKESSLFLLYAMK